MPREANTEGGMQIPGHLRHRDDGAILMWNFLSDRSSTPASSACWRPPFGIVPA
jgi:hypothetical protein